MNRLGSSHIKQVGFIVGTTLVIVAFALALSSPSVAGANAEGDNTPQKPPRLGFAVCGDPHYGWTDTHHADEIVDTWMNDKNFPRIEFGINMGDFCHFGSAEGYKTAMENSFNNMLLPWMFTFGNHDTADYKTGTGRDIYGEGGSASRECYDRPYDAIRVGKAETGVMQRNYAFEWDNILFLVFGDKGNTQLLTHEQRQWLNFMTDLYPDKTTITVSHQAPHGESSSYYRYYNNKEWWDSFIDDNPQLVLHINAHNHTFKHYTSHGLDAIDTGLTNGHGDDKTVYFQITDDKIIALIWDVSDGKISGSPLLMKSIDTGLSNEGLEWYSTSKRVQDGQEFVQYNRILANGYRLQLIGSGSELVEQNKKFDFWGSGGGGGPLNWEGYEDDANNGSTSGHVVFEGVDTFAAATKPAMGYQGFGSTDWYTKWIDGKVPASTTPRAIPGKEYTIRVRMKADAPLKNAADVSVKVLGENLRNVVMRKTPVLKGVDLTSSYRWYENTFTVPDNREAWIIKTIWDSRQSGATCYLDEWSVTRAGAGNTAENFTLNLNGETYSHSGTLSLNHYREFSVDPETINNDLDFSPNINGSKAGMVRMVYENPVLWSDDISIGVNSIEGGAYNCRFEMVLNYTPNRASLSPLQDNVHVEDATPINVKNYYTAWVMDNEKIPGNYTVSTPLKPSPKPWFVDQDDEVGLSDLMQVAGHFGESGTEGWIPSDVDGSGKVGLTDLMQVAGHWGETR